MNITYNLRNTASTAYIEETKVPGKINSNFLIEAILMKIKCFDI